MKTVALPDEYGIFEQINEVGEDDGSGQSRRVQS